MKRIALILVLTGFMSGSAAATPQPRTESAHSGPVVVELAYVFDEATDDFARRFTHMHIRINRGGAVLVDADLQTICRGSGCPQWPASGGDPRASSVRAVDLDRDGEPEVLLDLTTAGAHCCLHTTFFRFDGSHYVRRVHNWSNPGYRLRDLGGDGRPEFLTADDRFNYAFSCFACSAAPLLVRSYAQGRLTNVTPRFPLQTRADAARIWGFYRKAVRLHMYPSGVLPAYLADEYLLGRGKAGWTRVRKAVARKDWVTMVEPRWKNRTRYLASLRRFLQRTGYAP
jgi:hypothetical protein